jgi:F0F1-type ATP synthase assembly protein I
MDRSIAVTLDPFGMVVLLMLGISIGVVAKGIWTGHQADNKRRIDDVRGQVDRLRELVLDEDKLTAVRKQPAAVAS